MGFGRLVQFWFFVGVGVGEVFSIGDLGFGFVGSGVDRSDVGVWKVEQARKCAKRSVAAEWFRAAQGSIGSIDTCGH